MERIGRYEIILPIAKGGMATVYLARAEGVGGFDRYVATRPVYLVRNGTSELPALESRYRLAPLAAPDASNVLQVSASPLHDGPVAPPAGSSEPCR